MTITPNQNLVLRDIEPAWKDDILAALQVCALWWAPWMGCFVVKLLEEL